MWLSPKIFSILEVAKDSADSIRTELAVLKVERDLLKSQLLVSQTNFDWLRVKVNQLEYEKTALIQKAYNITLPSPEIVRQPLADSAFDPKSFSFEDVGDTLAKKLGLPVWGDSETNS